MKTTTILAAVLACAVPVFAAESDSLLDEVLSTVAESPAKAVAGGAKAAPSEAKPLKSAGTPNAAGAKAPDAKPSAGGDLLDAVLSAPPPAPAGSPAPVDPKAGKSSPPASTPKGGVAAKADIRSSQKPAATPAGAETAKEGQPAKKRGFRRGFGTFSSRTTSSQLQEQKANPTDVGGQARGKAAASPASRPAPRDLSPDKAGTTLTLSLGSITFGSEENHPESGFSLSLIDMSNADYSGLRLSGIDVVYGDMDGIQFGLVNGAGGTLSGMQLGAVNYADRLNGFQGGFLNIASSGYGVQIGLLNFILDNKVPMMPFINIGF